MGFKRYKGPVTTVEEAMRADMAVRICCARCDHFRQMHAYKLMTQLQAAKKNDAVKLWEPVRGIFACRLCHSNVVTIRAPNRIW